MQTFYKRMSVFAGFAVLLAILVANAFITRRDVSIQVRNEAETTHSRRVLYELSRTESLLEDAETGQRGYLYTGDPKYLGPYDSAEGQVASHIESLAQLTGADANDSELVPELRVLAAKKLGELAQTIALYRAGKQDEARALVLSDVGRFDMDRIRALIGRMQMRSAAAEQTRATLYQKSIRGTIASIYLASLLGVVGLVALAYYILREMELRERHSAELRTREEWLRVTLTSIGDGVIATDAFGMVTFLNPVAEKITGIPFKEAIGKDIRVVFPLFNEITAKPVDDPVRIVLQFGHVVGLANHTVVQNVDGQLIPIEDSAASIRDDLGRLLGVVLVFRDVTEARRAQEMMRKTEKLAAAARLSATMAHEINNPLEAVVNLVYIAKSEPGMPPAAEDALAQAEQELERIAHLTRQTLAFYRESSTAQRVDLAAIIDSVINIYSSRLRNKSISVHRSYAVTPQLLFVPGELKQVISNLISNAADAAPRNGNIEVRTRVVESAGGQKVEIEIEDDGPGVPGENLDRIFEPFFTTKQDVGTGLGLWITKEIVNRYGGSISVRNGSSGNGRDGAIFTIAIPVSAAAAASPDNDDVAEAEAAPI